MTDDEDRAAMKKWLEKQLSECRQRVSTLEAMIANWEEPKWTEWCASLAAEEKA
jgi:hypothetical protein